MCALAGALRPHAARTVWLDYCSRSLQMIAKRTGSALLATFTSVACSAASLACNAATPGWPATSAPAPTASAPVHPSIVGTVLLSSTHKPAPLGGVVYLEDAPKEPGALQIAHIAINHKEFTPFISILTTGGTATFENTDPTSHHVFSPDLQGWDTGFLQNGHPVAKTFESPGPIVLLCNIHPEMLGYLLVIPSTRFGKIDAGGKYVVGDVPPGTYKATAWIPRSPTVTEPVTVAAAGPVTADFVVNRASSTQ